MEQRAQVTSVEALESFRASLILFLSKARPTLEEVSNEVLRTTAWLQNEQRNYWDKQMRLRARELERAQQELFSARLSKLQKPTAAQEIALHRAQRAIREAEAKQQLVKKWSRDLENRTEPLLKQVAQLHGFLTKEMTQAVAYLAQAVKTLEAYAEAGPRSASSQSGLPGAAEALKPANETELSGSPPPEPTKP